MKAASYKDGKKFSLPCWPEIWKVRYEAEICMEHKATTSAAINIRHWTTEIQPCVKPNAKATKLCKSTKHESLFSGQGS
jgi:hypothetical protein